MAGSSAGANKICFYPKILNFNIGVKMSIIGFDKQLFTHGVTDEQPDGQTDGILDCGTGGQTS